MEYEEEYEDNGLRLIRKSGIPILYILAVCSNLIGMIFLGIITDYWANLSVPMCFLYSQTSSLVQAYTFGGAISTCYWVSYGAIVPTIIALACGIFYMLGIFGDPDTRTEEKKIIRNTWYLLGAMTLASVLMLAVCCTLAEGMRITCTNMNLNSANSKSDSCMDKLNLRVAQYQLPVQTSTMVTFGQVGLWTGMVAFIFLVICHSIELCRIRK